MRWWLALMLVAGCHDGPPPDLAGCSKDVDCKGARICVERQCVDPIAPSAERPLEPVMTPEREMKPEPVKTPEPGTEPEPGPTSIEPHGPEHHVDDSPSSTGDAVGRCGCPSGDLSCAMRCAQRGNAADPSTWPNDETAPQPQR